MFGALGRCFEEDPFFRDPFAAHHEYMRQMMRSFSDPFGRDPFLSITDGRERTADRRARQDSQVALRGNRRATSYSLLPFSGFGRVVGIPEETVCVTLAKTCTVCITRAWTKQDADFGDPFFAMDRMMSNMRNSMLEMQRKFDDLSVHPDAHTFSSSSVMTYSKVGDEPPKVFQAAAQTRTAPGGVSRLEMQQEGGMLLLQSKVFYGFSAYSCSRQVKEIRKALKDSESGVEKMAIGHHIRDRAHVVKKSKNRKTGDEEMNQEFINLDENEAQSFDEEWQKEISKFKPSRSRCNLDAPREKPLASVGFRGPRVSMENNLSVKGTHVPIKSSKK
ncbi:myeloid leukemia factor 1 isoform X1 [Tympanuchus pallidicinctus]|uniref:myeloid leukemia factor 1 isoform X1 n=1 Tax=Tympanuchus pallidicinctus TaxID=109042 RepID=UPI0022875E58|nr:myeloid leukemia factor 1 isoform X1 [Tympanuchus pallidicinctus]